MGPFTPLGQGFPLRRGANRLRFALPEGAEGYLRLRWP
jgi:hypothetical protein